MYEFWRNTRKDNAAKHIMGADVPDPYTLRPDTALIDWMGVPEDSRVLDFACGAGRNTFYMCEKYYKVYAYDFPNMINILKDNPKYFSTHNLVTLDNWGLARTISFDAIFCCICLQHIATKDLQFYLKEFVNMTDNLFVHGRDYNDIDNDNMYEILNEYWQFDKGFNGITEDKIKTLPRGSHYYAKWVPRV